MKRLFAGITAFLLALCASGCDGYGLSTDGTLFPPVLTEQQNAIYAALREQVPDDIQLCYPLTGSYRSAFIMTDIDEEPTEEAIVFYRSALQGNRSAAVRVNVLDQTEGGGWVSTCDVAAPGDEIDQVDFGSFGTPEFKNLMVGCRDSGTGEETLTIYRYLDGMLEGHANYGCQIFSAFRRSGEAPDGVVFIADKTETEGKKKGTGEKTAEASLVLWRNGKFEIASAVSLHEDVADYAELIPGGTVRGETALFLDGYLDGALCTQILTLDGAGKLSVSFDLIEASRRTGEIYCIDIDGDGTVEVPSEAEAPRFDEEDGETPAYYVDWLSPDGKGFEIRETNYVNFSNGYRLVVPQLWKESVAVRAVPDMSEVEFYTVQAETEIELLRIRTVRSTDIEQNVSRQGYINLASVGQITYFAKINLDTDSVCRVTREMLTQRFFTLL